MFSNDGPHEIKKAFLMKICEIAQESKIFHTSLKLVKEYCTIWQNAGNICFFVYFMGNLVIVAILSSAILYNFPLSLTFPQILPENFPLCAARETKTDVICMLLLICTRRGAYSHG